MTSVTFAALGIAEPLVRALDARSFTIPTPIQADAIPALLKGRDLLGIAQTGSGKTAAFTLPILQHLGAMNVRVAPFCTRALILAPTRELALQIEETVRTLAVNMRIRTAIIIGGASRFKQVETMRRGADIVIGTPGRVRDLMNTRELNLNMVSQFVLDEADRMLDLGFIRDIQKIAAALPAQKQTSLFSATMPREVVGLAEGLLKQPVRVEIAQQADTTPNIAQQVHHVPQAAKQSMLAELLTDPELSRVIVFTRTKHGANKVAEKLEMNGIQVNAIHGNKSQPQREKALKEFRSGRARVLVATDIAARGIDVTGISHVINFDLPMEPESYVHRIGRTARAGAAGIAISFCDPAERSQLRAIERQIGAAIPVVGGQPIGDDDRVTQMTNRGRPPGRFSGKPSGGQRQQPGNGPSGKPPRRRYSGGNGGGARSAA